MTTPLLPLIIEPADYASFLRAPATRPADIVLVDVGSADSYRQGHIPGAIHVNTASLICGEKPAPGRLPDISQLEELFSQLGIGANTHVIAYDDEGGAWAGRFLWTLEVIGQCRYSYINGGLLAWRSAGLPLETNPNQPLPQPRSIALNTTAIVETADIVARLGQPGFCVWDARSPEEYRGEKVLAQRGGHIPGAINCEFTNLLDRANGCRIRSDAREYLAGLGINDQQQIVTHCQTHRRSGLTWLVGKSLGFDIRAYPGSWSEWGNQPDTPVER